MMLLNEKLQKIKLVITDIDGVLTDGLLHYDVQRGSNEKFPCAMDWVSVY